MGRSAEGQVCCAAALQINSDVLSHPFNSSFHINIPPASTCPALHSHYRWDKGKTTFSVEMTGLDNQVIRLVYASAV